jgi:glutathione S-transferase
MTLRLYFHPLASFCWKTLIALYENETPFEPVLVDLGDATSRSAFLAVWPLGKFPVLRDESRDQLLPETSIIIEYLEQYYPGKTSLISSDPDRARNTRLLDRFYDLYVSEPMQKIVGDRLRPVEQRDALGVQQAKAALAVSYGMIEQHLAGKLWLMGDHFSMADCSAAPALFYGDKVVPLGDVYPNTSAYLQRLRERPAFARVLREAEPYFKFFPQET